MATLEIGNSLIGTLFITLCILYYNRSLLSFSVTIISHKWSKEVSYSQIPMCVLPVTRYPAEDVSWPQEETDAADVKTRKL